MRPQRGYTLIELMVVVAMIAITAALAVVGSRTARKNASVDSVSFDLTLKLQELRTKALSEQKDYLAVFLAGDAGACLPLRPQGCVRLVVLAAPLSTWTLGSFSIATPGNRAEYVDTHVLPNGVRMHLTAAGMAGTAPFTAVRAFDTALAANCPGSPPVRCIAFRFDSAGVTRGETASGAIVQKAGNILALATDLEGSGGNTARRAILVSFPAGIVKSYAY